MRKLLIVLTLSLFASTFFLAAPSGCTPAQNAEFNDPETSPERKVELAADGVKQATSQPIVQAAAAVLAPGWGNVALTAVGGIATAVGGVAGYLAGQRKKNKPRKRKPKSTPNAGT